jgi:hypothetical protein
MFLPAVTRVFATGEFNMVTDPASTIKREVFELIDLQIAALRQASSLDSSQLQNFRARAERLRTLYEELDRIGREKTALRFARAS